MSEFIIDADIAKAKTLSTDFYISNNYFEEAKEKIFSSSWQFIGSSELVKIPGSCYPFKLLKYYLDEPLLLTRDKENQLHCLSNVCTHRGNLLIYEPCTTMKMKCKYHGRLFTLDGKMHSMPEFREVQDFPSPSDDLHQLELFQWGKWLFTTLNKKV